MALINKKIVAISCGETHTLALTEGGLLYSFGGNTCGQLGQYTKEMEKARGGRKSGIDEIIFPKHTLESNPYSFMSSTDSPPDTPSDRKDYSFNNSNHAASSG